MIELMSDEQHPLSACGRWLMSITTEDAEIIQQTREFRDFINMVEKIQQTQRHNLSWKPNRMMVDDQDDDDLNESDNDGSEDTPLLINLKSEEPSFLQHCAADDIILRVFDFLECHDLVKTMQTCSRFQYLVVRNAKRRTKCMSNARQLGNVMQLLRAQEQIHGVGIEVEKAFVRIPTLLLSRRVLITNSGDPEYNGLYYCTGTNGNGFVFTKPRYPERRVNRRNNLETPSRLMQETVVNHSSLVETELDQTGDLLRCIIAKRFSNETILWYLSKEVMQSENEEEDTEGEISQRFSFWAKLMVIGDASPDVCRYPSQTSILTRHSNADGWQNLSTTRSIQPPVVELLD